MLRDFIGLFRQKIVLQRERNHAEECAFALQHENARLKRQLHEAHLLLAALGSEVSE